MNDIGVYSYFYRVYIKSGSKTVEELIDTSTQERITKRRTTQYERGGNYKNAVDDFNSLNPQNVRELPNGKSKIKFRYREH